MQTSYLSEFLLSSPVSDYGPPGTHLPSRILVPFYSETLGALELVFRFLCLIGSLEFVISSLGTQKQEDPWVLVAYQPNYDGLNKNGPCKFLYLNDWSPDNGTV